MGYRKEAVAQLGELERFIRPQRSFRVTLAKGFCRSTAGLGLVRLRRRLMERRRHADA